MLEGLREMDDQVTLEEWQLFYQRNFGDRQQRRKLLLKWQAMRWPPVGKPEEDRVAAEFERFIRLFLYDSPAFHLRSDCVLVFGDRYPISFEWMSIDDRRFCARLFELHRSAFAQCKEYNNNRIDFSEPLVPETTVFDDVWRMQIVRDFIYIVYGLRRDTLVLELIAAVQKLLLVKHKKPQSEIQRFLAAILAGLQGASLLGEVLCIE
jgi:hypothetical protein